MLRRYLVGMLILPLFLLAAAGCGGGGAAESPKVENPNVKIKPVAAKTGEAGGGGARTNFE
jgi:hypothetical protein